MAHMKQIGDWLVEARSGAYTGRGQARAEPWKTN